MYKCTRVSVRRYNWDHIHVYETAPVEMCQSVTRILCVSVLFWWELVEVMFSLWDIRRQ